MFSGFTFPKFEVSGFCLFVLIFKFNVFYIYSHVYILFSHIPLPRSAVFWDMVSLCCLGWPALSIFLPRTAECWKCRHVPPQQTVKLLILQTYYIGKLTDLIWNCRQQINFVKWDTCTLICPVLFFFPMYFISILQRDPVSPWIDCEFLKGRVCFLCHCSSYIL
jgi:hypothetical protein